MGKSVFLAGLFHETHTFLNDKTGLDEFRRDVLRSGDDIVSKGLGNGSPTDGFLSFAGKQSWKVIPSIQMAAMPSGTVTGEALSYFHSEFFSRLELVCRDIDGIFLVLHGAMVAENCDDVEGDLLEKIDDFLRERGLKLPVVAVLDLHANVSEKMCAHSSCFYAYRQNPHNDARDAAVQAASLLGELMDNPKASQVFLSTPYVLPPTGLGTANNPMKAVLARARELEAADSDILCINVMAGYAYADIADCGFSFNCCTRGDVAKVQSYLEELQRVLETHLEQGYPEEAGLEEVLAQVDAAPKGQGPVLLVEAADNIGGGTPGDGTDILGPFLLTGRKNLMAIICDPGAADYCHQRSIGDSVSLMIGAKTDKHHGKPIRFEGKIAHLSDGKFELENKNSHLASMMGTSISMGPCAVLKNAQAQILLTSRKTPPMDLGQVHSQGLRPEDADFVLIKAAVSHRDAYDPIASASYNVDSAGLCTSNLKRLPFQKLTGKHIALDQP